MCLPFKYYTFPTIVYFRNWEGTDVLIGQVSVLRLILIGIVFVFYYLYRSLQICLTEIICLRERLINSHKNKTCIE